MLICNNLRFFFLVSDDWGGGGEIDGMNVIIVISIHMHIYPFPVFVPALSRSEINCN